jgi:hypothetical protein
MWIRCLFTMMLLAVAGCGESNTPPAPAPAPAPFELAGKWLYLGPSDVPHNLTVTDTAMDYSDVDGHWSSSWTIKAHDNGAHHFQVLFGSGSGTYIPVGDSMSGAYEVDGTFLTVQLAKGLAAYPPLQGPGTCTGTADGMPVPDCRLYVKQN